VAGSAEQWRLAWHTSRQRFTDEGGKWLGRGNGGARATMTLGEGAVVVARWSMRKRRQRGLSGMAAPRRRW
jgi:hypothetical protein